MEAKIIKPKEQALVVRHNKLIEAKYEATLQQQRVMLWLISEIKPEDRDFQTYRVNIKELAKYIGIEGNKKIYTEIAEPTGGMVGRVLEIGSLDTDRYLQVGLISSADYKIGEGYVDLSIDPKLRPYLLDLKANFTKAYLHDLMSMKSVYSIRLYDLLNQYRKIGRRKIEVSELRDMLRIKKKYPLYANFKVRVVNTAIKEINERTDLLVDFKEEKKGRTVHSLIFTIGSKKGFRSKVLEVETTPVNDNDLFQQMVKHGMAEKQADKFIKLYGESDPGRISDNIRNLEIGLEQKKIPKPGGWLKKAIEEDWREQKSLFQQTQEQAEKDAGVREENTRKRNALINRLEIKIEKQEGMYLEYRQKFIRDIINEQEKSELEKWVIEFGEQLEDIRGGYWKKKPDWTSKLFIAPVEQFISQKIGMNCVSEEQFYADADLSSMAELEAERQALL